MLRASCFFAALAFAGAVRQSLLLDDGWRFRGFRALEAAPVAAPDFPPEQWAAVAAAGFDDSSWDSVRVPHDFVIEQALNGTFNEHEPSAGGTKLEG